MRSLTLMQTKSGKFLAMLEHLREYAEKSDFDMEKTDRVLEFLADLEGEGEVELEFTFRVVDQLLYFRPDQDTLFAVLLYDLYALGLISEREVREIFSAEVAALLLYLKGVFSLGNARYSKASHKEVLRKMFMTMAKDLRVIVIWLIVRLCQFDDFEPASMTHSQEAKKFAEETMSIYVPIASRLGIYRLKTELEDRAFKYLDYESYHAIEKQVQFSYKRDNLQTLKVVKDVRQFLERNGVRATVLGRLKAIYSIHRKLLEKRLHDVTQLNDFFAIRVILETQADTDALYGVLGLVHSEWQPVSSRFKDYVAVPKQNGYRSLHTVVLGLLPDKMRPVEIQIRDEEMNRQAEYGYASHWLYKDGAKAEALSAKIDWIKGLSKMADLFGQDQDFMRGLSLDIFQDRIFVLTPHGDVKDLAAGATPIDFAYAVHTDVGNHCATCKVNGDVVAMDHALVSGDVVEIITRTSARPKLQWLSKVRTSFARNKIKAFFHLENREENVREGRRLLNEALKKIGRPALDHNYSILKVYDGDSLTMAKREALLEDIGRGTKSASLVVKKLFRARRGEQAEGIVPLAPEEAKVLEIEEEAMVVVGGQSALPVKLAACCKPHLGDQIVAYVTRGNRITVHRSSCHLVDSLDGKRLMVADWKQKKSDQSSYRASLKIKLVSRVGMFRDISTVIADLGISIVDIRIEDIGGGLAYDYFMVDYNLPDSLSKLVEKLSKVDGVLKVFIENEE